MRRIGTLLLRFGFCASVLLPGAVRAAVSASDAYRLLAQASFGGLPADAAAVQRMGFARWIDAQIAQPAAFSYAATAYRAQCYPNLACNTGLGTAFWLGAVQDPAQLRQRMTFALSQIFVVGSLDGTTYYWGNALGAFGDVLYKNAFGNFRTLLEAVTRNQAMGAYLSLTYNKKEDPVAGTIPDQNYAREVMQLFTIGLVQLNPNGTPVKVNGKTVPTYTQDDVVGASRVLTGFGPPGAQDWWFRYNYCACQNADTPAQFQPMVGYQAYHSTSEKKFLGVTIPADPASDPDRDLKVFLDTLFNHPNTGPFIGRQLIQRLVTSNPSPAYVQRVAAVFADDGTGVRGNMGAVVRAILLDREARDPAMVSNPTYGKIREPVLRLAHLFRVFGVTADQDWTYHIPVWSYDTRKGTWQNPFASPTVFNFYYPDYTPPGSALAAARKVAPEMQITTATSISDQNWFFTDLLQNNGLTGCCSDAARNTWYARLHYDAWVPDPTQWTLDPAGLADRLSLVFMAGQMSPRLKADLIAAINAWYSGLSYTSGIQRGVGQMQFAEALRTLIASPDYIVQK